MAQEVERKFLVCSDTWRKSSEGERRYHQGYLVNAEARTVRVRLSDDGAWLTVKGPRVGLTRSEFEYSIPFGDAKAMLATLVNGSLVEKTRHRVPLGSHLWEIDEFHGDNAGLVLAEIELEHEAERFMRPEWLGEEVSDDSRYYSSQLAKNPFSLWGNV